MPARRYFPRQSCLAKADLFSDATSVRERTDRKASACFDDANKSRCWPERIMDLLIVLIVLLPLFGGGGGLYWGFGAGWGMGPIGLIILVLVVAFLLNNVRGRRGK